MPNVRKTAVLTELSKITGYKSERIFPLIFICFIYILFKISLTIS